MPLSEQSHSEETWVPCVQMWQESAAAPAGPRAHSAAQTRTGSRACLSLPAGVGGIETEAVMLGLPVSLTLPEVVGCELTGSSNPFVTSIDIVLGVTKVRGYCVAVGLSGTVFK